MFTKFNKQYKTIFVDPSSSQFTLDDKVNVILSPALYWVKKVSLPVKYVRDAMKLLPSIFEDTIPEGKYSYSAYISGDDFIVFAYEDRVILDTLQEKGIATANIANVYFAQSELSHLESGVKITESQSIYVKDEIVLLVPCCWVEEIGGLNLSTITHSKHTITLAQFGHIVDNKSLYKIGALLATFIVLLSVELFITIDKKAQVESAQDELFSKYRLKATMFQNRAMLKKYTKIHKTQTELRELFSKILSLRVDKEIVLSQINVKDKKVVVSLRALDDRKLKILLEKLKRKNMKFTSSYKKSTLQLEIQL